MSDRAAHQINGAEKSRVWPPQRSGQASEAQGTPISAKFEIEDGKTQLSPPRVQRIIATIQPPNRFAKRVGIASGFSKKTASGAHNVPRLMIRYHVCKERSGVSPASGTTMAWAMRTNAIPEQEAIQ
jgi:hypothetical protein